MEVVARVCSDLIQLPLCNSWRTILFFLRTNLNRLGARYLGASPSNQLWRQKRAVLPLPMVTMVEELKRRQSVSMHNTCVPTQGLGLSPHSCQSHRRCKALQNLSRSGTAPPCPLAPWVCRPSASLSSNVPPLVFSSPFQRNIF
jgi:hypothetical protein